MCSAEARKLAEAFWPGGLTLILHAQPSLDWDLGDTKGTVALRMPADEVAQELLTLTGPLAVSSANRTGQAPAQTAVEARSQLAESVEVYLEGGLPAGGGNRRAAVHHRGRHVPPLRVVREGAVSLERLREVVPGCWTLTAMPLSLTLRLRLRSGAAAGHLPARNHGEGTPAATKRPMPNDAAAPSRTRPWRGRHSSGRRRTHRGPEQVRG